MDNPDQASEIALLRSYAGEVSPSTIRRLTAAFEDLRKLCDDGQLAYPYSTRELVNITRHMEQFPEDSMNTVLENIFAFDSFDGGLLRMLQDVFKRHGIPVGRTTDVFEQETTETELAIPKMLPDPVVHATWSADLAAPVAFAVLQWPVRGAPLAQVSANEVDSFGEAAIGRPTGAWPYNRSCAQQYVGKSQSCMVISGRLIVHAPV